MIGLVKDHATAVAPVFYKVYHIMIPVNNYFRVTGKMSSALAKVDISDSAHLKALLESTNNPLLSIKFSYNLLLFQVKSTDSIFP